MHDRWPTIVTVRQSSITKHEIQVKEKVSNGQKCSLHNHTHTNKQQSTGFSHGTEQEHTIRTRYGAIV